MREGVNTVNSELQQFKFWRGMHCKKALAKTMS